MSSFFSEGLIHVLKTLSSPEGRLTTSLLFFSSVQLVLSSKVEEIERVRELLNQEARIIEEDNEEKEYERFCRICFEDKTQGILISPCLCKNSIGSIHYECLKEWRKSSHRIITACEICKFEYQFYKPKVHRVLYSIFTNVGPLIIVSTSIYCKASFLRRTLSLKPESFWSFIILGFPSFCMNEALSLAGEVPTLQDGLWDFFIWDCCSQFFYFEYSTLRRLFVHVNYWCRHQRLWNNAFSTTTGEIILKKMLGLYETPDSTSLYYILISRLGFGDYFSLLATTFAVIQRYLSIRHRICQKNTRIW